MSASRISMVHGKVIVAFLLFIAALFALGAPAFAVQASEAEDPTTGLYDEAGVLSDSEASQIESRIDEVEAAGAPTVVYLRVQESDEDGTVRDAQQLMEDWDLESEPDARDGFVIFLNLNPDDLNRGNLGVVAGEAHFDGGALPQSELDRIRDEMIERLADDRMADGIIRGLELAAERLEAGPPEPSAFESFVERVASGPTSPLNIVAVAAAALLGLAGWRTWTDRPRSGMAQYRGTTELPDDVHPAIAGALAEGRVRHQQIEATMIVLGERGALQFEPDPEDEEQVQVCLLDRTQAETRFEAALLETLHEHAEDGVLRQSDLQASHSDWNDIQEVIRRDLQERGWFDPNASQRRRSLIYYGVASVLLGGLSLVTLGFLDEPWPLIGAGVLGANSIVLFALYSSYPSTTIEGERAAASWRAYRRGMNEAARNEQAEIDLDKAFPYIVALGLAADYHDRLENASERGYVPAWFRVSEQHGGVPSSWFIYWIAFHGAMTPQSSGASGGAPGGAAAGSGGSGGSF